MIAKVWRRFKEIKRKRELARIQQRNVARWVDIEDEQLKAEDYAKRMKSIQVIEKYVKRWLEAKKKGAKLTYVKASLKKNFKTVQ